MCNEIYPNNYLYKQIYTKLHKLTKIIFINIFYFNVL